MNATRYEEDLRHGLMDAIQKLAQIEGFVLYAFNVWTDPDAGASAFSAETRSNSHQVVRQMEQWQRKTAEKLDELHRQKWKEAVLQPYRRNNNPADFAYRNIVMVEHADWEQVIAAHDKWDLIEHTLTKIRDAAAVLIGQELKAEPDAEVSIGTRNDWYDKPVPVVRHGVDEKGRR